MNPAVALLPSPGSLLTPRAHSAVRLWKDDLSGGKPLLLLKSLPEDSVMLVLSYPAPASEFVFVLVDGLVGYVSIVMVTDEELLY